MLQKLEMFGPESIFLGLKKEKYIFRIFAEKCSDNAACEEPTK